jgi:hypothetical protein
VVTATATAAVVAGTVGAAAAGNGFIGGLHHNQVVASTVPANGDVNPYGVAVVPRSQGRLVAGDVLVSNFNNAPTRAAPGGEQGRGTTVVEISPTGHRQLFARIPASSVPGGVGLTTALVALRSGWVIVGSLPTSDGTSATMRPGELFVLNSSGAVRETITGHGIDGPWDATVVDHGGSAQLFVSNVLNGIVGGKPSTTMRGDVVRLDLSLTSEQPEVTDSTVVADGLPVRTDPAALVVGPTGLAVGPDGSLFVADAVRSRIARVPAATTRSSAVDAAAPGRTVAAGAPLNGPLGLTLAPNGNLLAANGGNNDLVELTRSGDVVAVRNVDPADPPGGALFGLATMEQPDAVYYVNDDTNTLDVLR